MQLSEYVRQMRETELMNCIDNSIQLVKDEDESNELIEYLEGLANKVYVRQEALIAKGIQDIPQPVGMITNVFGIENPDEWGEFTH